MHDVPAGVFWTQFSCGVIGTQVSQLPVYFAYALNFFMRDTARRDFAEEMKGQASSCISHLSLILGTGVSVTIDSNGNSELLDPPSNSNCTKHCPSSELSLPSVFK